MTPSKLRPLGIGEIMDGAFALYRKHFGALVLVALVCGIPSALANLVPQDGLGIVLMLALMFVGSLAGTVGFAGLTWMCAELVLGRPATVKEALALGARNLLRVLISFLGVGLAVMLPLVGLGLAMMAVGWALGPFEGAAAVVAGFLAVLAPLTLASYLIVRYFAVYQVIVLERDRHFLKRSAVLARGAFWKISVVWTLGLMIVAVPWTVIGAGFLGVAFQSAGEGGEMAMREAFAQLAIVSAVLFWLVSALTTPFLTALGVVLYFDQRVRKDGLDVALAMQGLDVPPPGKTIAA